MKALSAGFAMLALLAGCDDMTKQAKQNPYASRQTAPGPVPPDTVRFGAQTMPAPAISAALLARGQVEYRAFCVPCHSETGDGHGMIVQRGFPAPPALTDARLLAASPQHFYDVITQGQGVMYSFAQRVAPEDRWAIAAYIHALQQSQHATLALLTPEQRQAP
jgi:mono/diheme cytochrome c family protein